MFYTFGVKEEEKCEDLANMQELTMGSHGKGILKFTLPIFAGNIFIVIICAGLAAQIYTIFWQAFSEQSAIAKSLCIF